MIDAEWWEYDEADECAAAVASDIEFIIERAIEEGGKALVAFPGGKTPTPIFERLAKANIEWKKVFIIPTDERMVALTDPMSNVGQIAKIFIPLGARVVPFGTGGDDYRSAGKAADKMVADLPWPPDLVWLGVGVDGHTASIFPSAEIDEALSGPRGRKVIGLKPDPLPPEAPVARLTLTRAAILDASAIMIVISGSEKRRVLEQALTDGAMSRAPIGRVLAESEHAIDIHWSAQ
jgi:6-phosphogluconolactonase